MWSQAACGLRPRGVAILPPFPKPQDGPDVNDVGVGEVALESSKRKIAEAALDKHWTELGGTPGAPTTPFAVVARAPGVSLAPSHRQKGKS